MVLLHKGLPLQLGVLEEFIILLFISGFCQLTHNSLLYLSFVVAYTSHFIIHYIMCLQFRGYVPGVVTVTLELPMVLMIIFHYWPSDVSLLSVVVYLLLAMVIAFSNLKIMHLIMPKNPNTFRKIRKTNLNRWLNCLRHNSTS